MHFFSKVSIVSQTPPLPFHEYFLGSLKIYIFNVKCFETKPDALLDLEEGISFFFNPIFQEASFPPKMHQTAKKGCFESKHKMHRSSLKNMTLEKYFFQIQTWRKPLLFLMDAHNHIKQNSFESKYTLHSRI